VNQLYEQKQYTQIQAVHAQSPRTVQRHVDQITSEIKNNCDLKKSINLKLNEEDNSEKVDTMEYEEHEPMEQVEEECFELPSRDINPFDKSLIAGLLKKIKFPQPHHADGYKRLDTNLNKFVPSTMITLGQYSITNSNLFLFFALIYIFMLAIVQITKRMIWKSALGKECMEQFLKQSICKHARLLLLKRNDLLGFGNIISYEK